LTKYVRIDDVDDVILPNWINRVESIMIKESGVKNIDIFYKPHNLRHIYFEYVKNNIDDRTYSLHQICVECLKQNKNLETITIKDNPIVIENLNIFGYIGYHLIKKDMLEDCLILRHMIPDFSMTTKCEVKEFKRYNSIIPTIRNVPVSTSILLRFGIPKFTSQTLFNQYQ